MSIQPFYSFGPNTEEMRIFLTVYIAVIAVVVLGVLIPEYIMLSIAHHRIAKRRGIKGAWLAWIPIAKYWIMGALADEFDKRSSGHDRHFRLVLLIGIIVYYIACAVFFVGFAAIFPLMENSINGSEFEVFRNIMQMAFGMEFGIIGMSFGGIAFTALYYICLYKLIESLSPKFSLLFFILSLFVGFFLPIYLLIMKNKGYPYPEETEEIPEAVRIGWYES